MGNPTISVYAGARRTDDATGVAKEFERGSLPWARWKIEEVKAGLRDDLGRAYSIEFTRAAEVLREHDPVQFNSLRRLLKDKQVRLGEFDRLIHQRQHERAHDNKRARAAAAARALQTTARRRSACRNL